MSDMFVLSDEHRAVREAVRALAEAEIAPYAVEVDEDARFPREAAEALVVSDSTLPTFRRSTEGPGPTRPRRCS